MARVTPFKALRPLPRYAVHVASPPYDVVTREEARALVRTNPLNFLAVEKSEIDLDLPEGSTGDIVYATARRNLERLIRDGILARDATCCYYIYRQRMGAHEQYGIVAGIDTAEYETGLLRRHELTRADKEDDRTRHISVVGAQTGPVFVAYEARPALDALVRRIAAGLPEYDFVADDGVGHTVWIIDRAEDIARVREEFAGIDRLYIADGHHRAAAAARVGRMRRGEPRSGDETCNGAETIMAVLFPHNQIQIMAYHRVVRDLAGLTREVFLRRVDEKFSLSDGFPGESSLGEHEFAMYLAGRWYGLAARPGTFAAADPVASLDVAILQENLLGPVLGIADPRTDGRIGFVGGIKGKKALEELVEGGSFAVAFFLRPVTLRQIIAVAEQGGVMPPKSTWFEPKLRSGIFVNLL